MMEEEKIWTHKHMKLKQTEGNGLKKRMWEVPEINIRKEFWRNLEPQMCICHAAKLR